MAMTPRYLLKGLGVTACDSGGGLTHHNSHIVTSEYDWETETFGNLGTVMSISSKGYDELINSEADNPYREAIAAKFVGASRLCVYADGGYPLQIEALIGYQSNGGVTFWPGFYTEAGPLRELETGLTLPAPPQAVSRFYITPVYQQNNGSVSFFLSTNSTFSKASERWPYPFMNVSKTAMDGNGDFIDWTMSKVQCVPYDAGLAYLAPLPGPVLENCGTGETGIIIGAEAHYVSGTGDEITEEIVDVSAEATYQITPGGSAWLDENRQLILADWATSAGVTITWDGMPGEVAQIVVLQGTWDDMGGDEGDDETGGDSGGDGGGGTDPGGDGGSGGDSGDDDPDDPGGSGGDGGGGDTDDTTSAAIAEARREAFMQGMATMAALYSRKVAQAGKWVLLYDGEVTTVYGDKAGTPGDGALDFPYGNVTPFVEGKWFKNVGDTVRVTFNGVQNTHIVQVGMCNWVGNEYLQQDMSETGKDDGGDYRIEDGLFATSTKMTVRTRTEGTHTIKIERLVT